MSLDRSDKANSLNVELKLHVAWKPNILIMKSEQVPLSYCKTSGFPSIGPILSDTGNSNLRYGISSHINAFEINIMN